MDTEIAEILAGADTTGWKEIKVDFGDDFLDIKVPDNCDILTMPSMPCLVDSAASITKALNHPTGSARRWKTLKRQWATDRLLSLES